MHYLKFKKEKIDICNICLEKKPLSWDHVPPQGGIKVTEVEQINIIQKLAITGENIRPRLSQNGVKFRTICPECNAILGSEFDRELNRFALNVKDILHSSLVLPNIIHLIVKPNKIIKSIFGHFLSVKTDNENSQNHEIDKTMRAFYFDKNNNIGTNLKVYYWLYPYQETIIIRDISMFAERRKLTWKMEGFNILKYYPIAYLITNLDKYEQLNELTHYISSDIEAEAEIPLNLTDAKSLYWPETVDGTDYNMLLTSDRNNSILATLKKKKPHIFNQ